MAVSRKGRAGRSKCTDRPRRIAPPEFRQADPATTIFLDAISPICGIYGLVDDGLIVYVGKSTNIIARIWSHRYPSAGRKDGSLPKNFDGFTVLQRCPEDQLKNMEDEWIHRVHPPLNLCPCRICSTPHGGWVDLLYA